MGARVVEPWPYRLHDRDNRFICHHLIANVARRAQDLSGHRSRDSKDVPNSGLAFLVNGDAQGPRGYYGKVDRDRARPAEPGKRADYRSHHRDPCRSFCPNAAHDQSRVFSTATISSRLIRRTTKIAETSAAITTTALASR